MPQVATALVSIGLPVYNGERWIATALQSLLGQTYDNLEIVVCDNASTDRTPAICREYAERDPRVRYFRNERNLGTRGPGGNFCRVLSHATGQYFMWASADDWRDASVVELCVEAFRRNPRAVLVHGPIELTLPSGDGYLANAMDLGSQSAMTRARNFTRDMQHNAMIYGLFLREALVRIRYGNHYAHDYLVCLQACLMGPVERIAKPLIRYRQRSDSLDMVMYSAGGITIKDLLLYRGVRRYKCWLALVVGTWYLLILGRPRLSERIAGAASYASSFVSRYRRHLAGEVVFILAAPLAWLAEPLRPLGIRARSVLRKHG